MNKQLFLDFLGDKLLCRIKPSKIEGVGVFAIKDIPKETKLFEAYFSSAYEVFVPWERWYSYPKEEIEDLDEGVKKLVYDFCEETEGSVAVCSNMPRDIEGGCIYLLNHSEEPNVKFLYPEGAYVTVKKIEKGEELCFNYSEDFKKAKEEISEWTE